MLIFGHPRGGKGSPKAWNPINLKDIDGEPDTAPTGTFRVRIGPNADQILVFQIGPEERPFPKLRELDIDSAAMDVVNALRDIRRRQQNM